MIGPVSPDRRQGLVQRLAPRVGPLAHGNPDPGAEPSLVVELGADKLIVRTQASLQEAGARCRNLHEDRIIASEREVDEELSQIRVTTDDGGCPVLVELRRVFRGKACPTISPTGSVD